MTWQTVDDLVRLSKRQLIEKLRGTTGPPPTGSTNTQKSARGTKGIQPSDTNRWRTQKGTTAQKPTAWYCEGCGTDHHNLASSRCRLCKQERKGFQAPPPKARPIQSPAVQSVFAQLRLIEQDEREMEQEAAVADADATMATTEPSPGIAEEAKLGTMHSPSVGQRLDYWLI